jgi:hypothetical protein
MKIYGPWRDAIIGAGETGIVRGFVRFEVFTAVTMKNADFWDIKTQEWCLLGCYAVWLL